MRLAGLPAAPVQFIVLPKKTSIFNFGYYSAISVAMKDGIKGLPTKAK